MARPVRCKIDDLELPDILGYDTRYIIVSDTTETARGNTRRDSQAVKREWPIETIPIPVAIAQALADYLSSLLFGEVEFWLDEFGDESNTVTALVMDLRLRRPDNPDDHRFISMLVREK